MKAVTYNIQKDPFSNLWCNLHVKWDKHEHKNTFTWEFSLEMTWNENLHFNIDVYVFTLSTSFFTHFSLCFPFHSVECKFTIKKTAHVS
jgi:hypothetical protein